MSGRERQIWYHLTYMWNLQKTLINIENKLVVTLGGSKMGDRNQNVQSSSYKITK